ncbi:MAG: hypothetical protein HYV39_01715 [Candidatus Levybacteria bacterium]|nr:hypothetical protein [Candidatus Levybacteria bacterium]
MANYEVEGVARKLRYEATMHLRGNENIRRALRFFSVREEGFAMRVGEFENVCQRLGSLIEGEDIIDPMIYKNVSKLKSMVGSREAPKTLIESIEKCEGLREAGEYGETDRIANALSLTNQKISSGEWPFVQQITDDPNKLASAVLIEGFGIYTEKLMNEPEQSGMERTVVLALEEVLLENYPNSALLQDVVGFMKEEKADFGEGTQARLESWS